MNAIKNYMLGMKAGGFRSFKSAEDVLETWQDLLRINRATFDHIINKNGGTRETFLRALGPEEEEVQRINDFIGQVLNNGADGWVLNGFASTDINYLIRSLQKFGSEGTAIANALSLLKKHIALNQNWQGAGDYYNRDESYDQRERILQQIDKLVESFETNLIANMLEYYLAEADN